MPFDTIAREFNTGAELHEAGLNLISRIAYTKRPDLFELREEIEIDKQAGRKLILYVGADEPISFNFTPITDGDDPAKRIFVLAKIFFTLTDELPGGGGIGLITRFRAEIHAFTRVVVRDSGSLGLDIEDLQVKEFVGDHPVVGMVPQTIEEAASAAVSGGYAALDQESDPAFLALMDYVTKVFLLSGMERLIEEIQLPPIHLIPKLDLTLYLRGLDVFGDRVGFYHLLADGPVKDPATPAPEKRPEFPHISLGVTEQTASKVLQKLLPITVPVNPTPDHKLFSIRSGSSFTIKRNSTLDFRSPNLVKTFLYFNAHINGKINVKLGGKWVRTNVVLPIGDPSHFNGRLIPSLRKEDDEFKVYMRPEEDFFSFQHILIVTDYRGLVKNAVRDWLRRHVSPIFDWIPIIGRIISKGVEEIVSEIIAGATWFFDFAASATLTAIANAAFHALRIRWNDTLDFSVTDFPAKFDAFDGVEIALENARIAGIHPNSGGELQVDAWVDRAFEPPPEPPIPTPLPEPNEPPTPIPPAPPQEPPADAFKPAPDGLKPDWDELGQLTYDIRSNVGEVSDHIRCKIQQSINAEGETLLTAQKSRDGDAPFMTCVHRWSAEGLLLEETTSQMVVEPGNPMPVELRTWLEFLPYNYTFQAEAQWGDFTPWTEDRSFPLESQAAPSDLWMLQLMRRGLDVGKAFVLAVPNWTPDQAEIGNFLTFFSPVALRVDRETDLEIGEQVIKTVVLEGEDSVTRFKYTAWVEEVAPHRIIYFEALRAAEGDRAEVSVVMEIEPEPAPE